MSDPEIWSTNLIKKFTRELWPSALSILHGIRRTCVRISTNFARILNFNRNRAFCPTFEHFTRILPNFEHFARILQFCTTCCPNFEHLARILPTFGAFCPNSHHILCTFRALCPNFAQISSIWPKFAHFAPNTALCDRTSIEVQVGGL